MVGVAGRSGRQRRPAALRKREGDRSKVGARKFVEQLAAEPRGIGMPQMSEHLSPEAARLWRDVVAALPAGLLSGADCCLLEIFCCEWQTFREADRDIQRRGLLVRSRAGRIRNPSLAIRDQAARLMFTVGAAIGLSPASRARLIAPSTADADPLSLLLGDDGDPAGAWSTKTRQ